MRPITHITGGMPNFSYTNERKKNLIHATSGKHCPNAHGEYVFVCVRVCGKLKYIAPPRTIRALQKHP